jgi:WD40 repeat protein
MNTTCLLLTVLICGADKEPDLKEVASWKLNPGTYLYALSPDGQTLAAGTASKMKGEAKLLNARTGKEIADLGDVGRGLSSSVFSVDGRSLATLDSNGKLAVRDAATGKEGKTFKAPLEAGRSVLGSFAADGGAVVLASDLQFRIFPLKDGGKETSFQRRIGGMDWAVSPDGKTAASPNYQDLDLWDVSAGKIRRTLADHHGGVVSAVFSGDNRVVAAAVQRNDGKKDFWQVQFWNSDNGKELSSITSDIGFLSRIFLDEKAETLVVTHIPIWSKQDVELRVYDVATARERFARRSGIKSALLSRDGKLLVTVEADNQIHVWDVPAK